MRRFTKRTERVLVVQEGAPVLHASRGGHEVVVVVVVVVVPGNGTFDGRVGVAQAFVHRPVVVFVDQVVVVVGRFDRRGLRSRERERQGSGVTVTTQHPARETRVRRYRDNVTLKSMACSTNMTLQVEVKKMGLIERNKK